MMTDGTRRTKSGRIKLVPAMTGWMIEYVGRDPEYFESYLSEEEGWVERVDADVYSDEEKADTELPLEGRWVSVQELHESRVSSMRSHPASSTIPRAHLIPLEGGGGANE